MRTIVILWAVALAASIASAGDNWPQFLGPTGDGQSDAGAAATWSETENVKWKTPIHDRGYSSPVIWGGQIWLTTAMKDGSNCSPCASTGTRAGSSTTSSCPNREAGAVSAEQLRLAHAGHRGGPRVRPLRHLRHGLSRHGQRAAAWERRDMHCDHFRGPGSSPMLCGDLLILHIDGFDVQYVIALDKQTGKTVWKTDRSTEFGNIDGDLRKAYATPLIAVAGRQQMISTGAKAAMAYDPKTGKELWKIRYDGFSNRRPAAVRPGVGYHQHGFRQAGALGGAARRPRRRDRQPRGVEAPQGRAGQAHAGDGRRPDLHGQRHRRGLEHRSGDGRAVWQ